MRTIETKVFQYAELDDDAKEKARDWYRSGALDYDWWDYMYEHVSTAARLIGIELEYRQAKNQKGEPIAGQPCIWFSGFSSQGDGACFEGTYRYAKGSCKAIRAEFGEGDTDLLAIVDGLYELQKAHWYRLWARVKHTGRYYHKYSTDIETDGFNEDESDDDLKELLRDFMEWIYRKLEAEHDYLLSDEAVVESIEANEYEFTKDGNRF